ncbi:MAG TPA: LemA family protein [Armatimonadetes bacterium]|nr:LemA family protein [Armatimonadota bacterium]
MIPFIVLLAVGGVIIIWLVAAYNGLVRLRNRCRNAWSQIEVQLKRRYDLIPNLVETVKGYLRHERETLEAVIRARQQAIEASGVAEQAAAENALTQTLRSLFALVENYPDLRANQNMLALQEELTSTENKIAFARQHYNDVVTAYNTKLQQIPTNFIASLGNFREEELFELEDVAAREVPRVQF